MYVIMTKKEKYYMRVKCKNRVTGEHEVYFVCTLEGANVFFDRQDAEKFREVANDYLEEGDVHCGVRVKKLTDYEVYDMLQKLRILSDRQCKMLNGMHRKIKELVDETETEVMWEEGDN